MNRSICTLKQLSTLMALAILVFSPVSAQVPQYVNPEGLMAWYPFTGGSTEDATDNNYDLQNLGCTPATDRFGNPNSAYQFDGSATYMRRNDFPFPQTSDCTVSFWFSRTFNISEGTFISRGESLNQQRTFVLSTSTENVSTVVGKSFLAGGQVANVSGSAPGTSWNHIVFVRSGENFARLFINGELVDETGINNFMLANVDFLVGVEPGPGDYFDGRMDDIGVWETALTECDVKKLFNAFEFEQPVSTTVGAGSTASFTVTINSEVSYQWQVNTGIGGWSDLTNFGQYSGVNNNTLTVNNTSLSNDNFAFRCIIDYGGGCTESTDIAILNVTSSTSVSDNSDFEQLNIFPNPNTGQFRLDLENTEFTVNATITVLDHSGKMVYNSQANSLQPSIDLGELAAGMYMLRVNENDLVRNTRVSVVK